MSVVSPLRVEPAPRTEPAPVQLGPADWTDRDVPGDYVQGTLAVDFDRACEDSFFGPQATTASDLPDPGGWARQMIRVALEVSDGVRPAVQLTRWVTTEIQQRLSRRGLLARRRRQRQRHPTTVRALLACSPLDGVAEVSAVVAHNGRIRAVALRMVGVDGRWLITVLEVG